MYNIENVLDIARKNGFDIKENESMSKHTTFKIGGNAQALIKVTNNEGLIDILKKCKECEIPVFILGKGSNLLVSDRGIDGIVIKLDGVFNQIKLIDDETICCGAGVSLAKLCSYACEHGLSGLEFAWGIPGSVGGAVYMNAGAYGGEMKDVLYSCAHIDDNNTAGTLNADSLGLSYRHSIYSENNYIITSATVKLKKDSSVEIRNRMNDYMNRRKDKQPVEYPSAGSVFKRPEGYFAGTLIQDANLKGKQIGGAQVSEKHAGFIINKGNATCNDVLELVNFIQEKVKEETGITLECEIKPIGKL
ncbi:MAG: UDP-N-acetylmuramate dehydrogenase [Acutalibacteraceae bacterium]|nr:UDP-N-acetylmuramate dehydrogenase [Acutalibacteraceae bacterium]